MLSKHVEEKFELLAMSPASRSHGELLKDRGPTQEKLYFARTDRSGPRCNFVDNHTYMPATQIVYGNWYFGSQKYNIGKSTFLHFNSLPSLKHFAIKLFATWNVKKLRTLDLEPISKIWGVPDACYLMQRLSIEYNTCIQRTKLLIFTVTYLYNKIVLFFWMFSERVVGGRLPAKKLNTI